MRRAILAAGLALTATTTWADGFVLDTLADLEVPDDILPGHTTETRAEAGRLTLMCVDCGDALVAVDVMLGRSEDGTETRYRSGETTIETLEAQCQARAPECTLTPVDMGEAVGWLSSYNVGTAAGSTAVLFLDGDQLILRSLAGTADQARENAALVLNRLGPVIVGN